MVATTALLLLACSEGRMYDTSVDVDADAWTPTDTLCYPMRVESVPSPRYPLRRDYPCRLSLTVRSECVYPMADLVLHIRLQDRTYRVALPLGDEIGRPTGGWSSTQVKEFDVTQCDFVFADTGSYVMQIWPDREVEHILSVTATLH